MGKSDPYIFREYLDLLSNIPEKPSSIAFLGFPSENSFTLSVESTTTKRDFFDLKLGNWEINSDWILPEKYDLIVCTRCAYFSEDPESFMRKCKDGLTERGHALIDWGLGDHWRFNNYKVGWVRDGEHEYAYSPSNKLNSCFWRDDLADDPQVKLFWDAVRANKSKHYETISDICEVIKSEVPVIVNYPVKSLRTKFLWPQDPQLYIITLFQR